MKFVKFVARIIIKILVAKEVIPDLNYFSAREGLCLVQIPALETFERGRQDLPAAINPVSWSAGLVSKLARALSFPDSFFTRLIPAEP